MTAQNIAFIECIARPRELFVSLFCCQYAFVFFYLEINNLISYRRNESAREERQVKETKTAIYSVCTPAIVVLIVFSVFFFFSSFNAIVVVDGGGAGASYNFFHFVARQFRIYGRPIKPCVRFACVCVCIEYR